MCYVTDTTDVAHIGLPRDPAFERFVQNPTFIGHFLRMFPIRFLDECDIVKFGRGQASRVGPEFERRRADALWEAEMKDGELVYLIVECQSYVACDMHTRMPHFGGIVLHDLSGAPPTKWGYTTKYNPRVIGLVVCSGEREWNAPLDTAESMRVKKPEDRRRVPTFEHDVLDLRRVPLPGVEGNLAVLLQRLYLCSTPGQLHEAADPLRGLEERQAIESAEDLGRALARWISWVLLHTMGVKGVSRSDRPIEVLGLLEDGGMNWADEIRTNALEQGLERGTERGRPNGLREMLARDAGRRLGEPMTESLAELVESVSDPQQLFEISDWLACGMSGKDLLTRLRQRQPARAGSTCRRTLTRRGDSTASVGGSNSMPRNGE